MLLPIILALMASIFAGDVSSMINLGVAVYHDGGDNDYAAWDSDAAECDYTYFGSASTGMIATPTTYDSGEGTIGLAKLDGSLQELTEYNTERVLT